MRFTKPFWAGIADGSITVAFRSWTRPTVVAGRPYRTAGVRIRVNDVDQIEPGEITAPDARAAGYESVADALDALRAMTDPADDDGSGQGERRLYRIRFELLDEPDPRSELANDDALSESDIAAITARLDRLDAASSYGAWTRPTLRLIETHQARRAPDLAAMVERETKPFKLDVRKLKNLGLTISLRVGYELSPRGRAYLDACPPVDEPR